MKKGCDPYHQPVQGELLTVNFFPCSLFSHALSAAQVMCQLIYSGNISVADYNVKAEKNQDSQHSLVIYAVLWLQNM